MNTKKRLTKSNDEIEERITIVGRLHALGKTKGEIKEFARREWNAGFRTVDRYLSRAKKKALNKPRESEIAISAAFLDAMRFDQSVPPAERIKASRGRDTLLGLDAPRRQELSGPDGSPIGGQTTVIYMPPEKD